jgi:hypothetical protein
MKTRFVPVRRFTNAIGGIAVLFVSSCSHPFPGGDDELALLAGLRFLDFRKYIFVTSQTHDGNFAAGYANGIAGADAFCQQQKDAFAPALPGFAFEYRALLVDSSNRIASVSADVGDGQVNWVLRPQTEYFRADGALLFTTNAASIFPMSSGLTNAFTSDAAVRWWTGLDTTWQTLVSCTNWTATAGFGTRGTSAVATTAALSEASNGCGTAIRLLCVRQ